MLQFFPTSFQFLSHYVSCSCWLPNLLYNYYYYIKHVSFLLHFVIGARLTQLAYYLAYSFFNFCYNNRPFLYLIILGVAVSVYFIHNTYAFYNTCKSTSLLYYFNSLPLILIKILLLKSGNVESQPGPEQTLSKSLSVCHMNIRSILAQSRLDELEDYIKTLHHFDVVALTETHLDANIQDSQLFIQGYTIYRKDRDRQGGGVAFYIADHLQSVRRLDLEDPNTEMIWVEINYKKNPSF
jgi:hypothetical protein